ncbi:MAG: RNA-guided pseudouridylation complex pseudouridine synthase subunit Cbf5, partial [Candidatus Pacearchaeota archaeon]
IKESLNLSKTSHFGTLDPKVTGVLPVALGRACRLMPYFIGRKKKYVGVMRTHVNIDFNNLEKEIQNFIGKIKQIPPVKSRVKREEREREVYYFKILECSGKDFLFETEVEAGTYVRKLVYDIGRNIEGAHMLELRRIEAGIFKEEESISILDFLKIVQDYKNGDESGLRNVLIPGEIISTIYPVIFVKDNFKIKLQHGSPLFTDYIKDGTDIKVGDTFVVFCDSIFIGVFKRVSEGKIVGRPEFVLQPII